MIVVDASILITALSRVANEYTAALRRAVSTGDVVVADLVLMELLRGASSDAAANRLLVQMAAFPVVQVGGKAVAIRAASYYRSLRAIGITIRSTVDVLLATYCIEHGHRLLHRDRDFDHFERFGLQSYVG